MNDVGNIYYSSNANVEKFGQIASTLVRNKYYYSAIPFLKEYLATRKGQVDGNYENIIDQLIQNVGVKQFEVMPHQFLQNSSSPTIRYVRAKKYFRSGNYERALELVSRGIPMDHFIKPFSLLLEANIYSITKVYDKAYIAYETCIDKSNDQISKNSNDNRIKQLEMNRDYCVIGIPRTQFSEKKFTQADLAYLDLPKSSYVWPEILFEEAWNSFYLNNYNRTLGKLVSYRAPILAPFFNPEIEVLKAMTFLHMCLYADASKTVDEFYGKYKDDAVEVRQFLRDRGKDYKTFYNLARTRRKGKVRGNELLNHMIKSVIYDSTYAEMVDSFVLGGYELERVKTLKINGFENVMLRNLKDSLGLQRNLIGGYIRKNLLIQYAKLHHAFEGLSFIKLEILSRRKEELYQNVQKNRSRGDIQYLERNEKQYFWTFNGEFWADELGDYVFALASECGEK